VIDNQFHDSDGWYDHVLAPSSTNPIRLKMPSPVQGAVAPLPGGSFQDRCGYGPRLPFMVISPWSETNFVDHTLIDQSSIIGFIEDNWRLPRLGNQS
jgi:phospholipase C